MSVGDPIGMIRLDARGKQWRAAGPGEEATHQGTIVRVTGAVAYVQVLEWINSEPRTHLMCVAMQES